MALMLYDLCNYLFHELRHCWGKILFPDEVYAYPSNRKIPEEVLNGDEEVVWKQPTSSDDNWDDFVQVDGL